MDDVFVWIIGGLIIITIVGTILVGSYQVVRDVTLYFFKDQIHRYLIFRNLNKKSKEFLTANFKYYQSLHGKDKRLFERRVQKFMDMKEFVPRGELKEVSLEMRTLIAASAIQITFGLPSVYLLHFYRILVYPDNYYSTITNRHHRGEVNTRGFIVLSWNNLVLGYANDRDGINLGLHEMAHALKIADAITSEEYDFLDNDVYLEFVTYAREEMQNIADGGESLFRAYAASNDFEFFSVAVENFFERPHEFKGYHERLYVLLSRLLNQDPLNK